MFAILVTNYIVGLGPVSAGQKQQEVSMTQAQPSPLRSLWKKEWNNVLENWFLDEYDGDLRSWVEVVFTIVILGSILIVFYNCSGGDPTG